MKNLLTLDYWFNMRPEALTSIGQGVFIGVLALLLLAAIVLWKLKKKSGVYRGLFKRLYGYVWSNLIIGLILFFFVYELVPFLSARFWTGIWLLAAVIWLAYILKSLKRIPEQKKMMEEKKAFNKYLPK